MYSAQGVKLCTRACSPEAAATTRRFRGILLLSTAQASLGELEVGVIKATHRCVRALLSQRSELPAAKATLEAHAVDAG